MATQWKQAAVVQSGGRVEVVIADLQGGESVEVTIRRNGANNGERESGGPRFGSGRGLIEIKPDFDAPLDDFREYQ